MFRLVHCPLGFLLVKWCCGWCLPLQSGYYSLPLCPIMSCNGLYSVLCWLLSEGVVELMSVSMPWWMVSPLWCTCSYVDIGLYVVPEPGLHIPTSIVVEVVEPKNPMPGWSGKASNPYLGVKWRGTLRSLSPTPSWLGVGRGKSSRQRRLSPNTLVFGGQGQARVYLPLGTLKTLEFRSKQVLPCVCSTIG